MVGNVKLTVGASYNISCRLTCDERIVSITAEAIVKSLTKGVIQRVAATIV